jgi:chemotaxis protein methyltransferase CheR
MSNDGLSTKDFDRLRTLVYDESGINLSADKKTMMEIRLKRRLRVLDLPSYREYCDHLFQPQRMASELIHLIDAITTNKTDFFREPDHFDYLISKALPDLVSRLSAARKCLIWSAGCSTGEEPYTLAMLMSEYAQQSTGFRFNILATDICTQVLDKAAVGIFKSESLAPVPEKLRRKYFMRSRDPASDLLRAVPELRSTIEFRRLNFMDADFGFSERPEILFCRNVIIYFDRPTQVRLLQKLTRQLAPGGYFFAGHSESFQGMDLPLIPVAPAVYRKSQ